MTNSADLIALCAVTLIVVAGGAWVATQPVRPGRRETLENALLERLAQPEPQRCEMVINGHRATITFDSALSLFRGQFLGCVGCGDFLAADVDGLRRQGEQALQSFLAASTPPGIDPQAK